MSISLPTTTSSTRTRASCSNAAVSAGPSSSGESTNATPRLEPAATGSITTGPLHSYAAAVAAVSNTPGAVATPTASATSLVAHLSIAIAPAPTPEPTYGR